MKRMIAIAIFLLVSFSAYGMSENNKTILQIGAQDYSTSATVFGPPKAYANLSPALQRGCLYGIIYVRDLSTTGGAALYAILRHAHAQSLPLSRIDYDQDFSSGQCFFTLIEVGK